MIKGVGDIVTVFNVFHDGVITEFVREGDRLRARILITYLANRVQNGFTFFDLILHDIRSLQFYTVSDSPGLARQEFRNLLSGPRKELQDTLNRINEERIESELEFDVLQSMMGENSEIQGLEIQGAKLEKKSRVSFFLKRKNKIVVNFYMYPSTKESTLVFESTNAEVYDEAGREVSVSALVGIAKEYWSEFGKGSNTT